jgi:hypothetical protein
MFTKIEATALADKCISMIEKAEKFSINEWDREEHHRLADLKSKGKLKGQYLDDNGFDESDRVFSYSEFKMATPLALVELISNIRAFRSNIPQMPDTEVHHGASTLRSLATMFSFMENKPHLMASEKLKSEVLKAAKEYNLELQGKSPLTPIIDEVEREMASPHDPYMDDLPYMDDSNCP